MPADAMVGQLFAGRYEIESLLGNGGMAAVYRAYDRRLGHAIALKIFFEPAPVVRRRFLGEARSLARLNHPGIVAVYEGGEDAGRSYIAMEIANGEDLRSWRMRGATIGATLRAMIRVLEALAFAHDNDVLHRDVKPSNIVVDDAGVVKLMDFGLSRRISDVSAGTQAGEIVGTVAYLPPERFLGKPSDARGDLYSLGIVLYELVTGHPPFRSESDDLVAVIFAHLNERPMPPRMAGAAIDADLEAIVLRLLEKQPADRFANARVVRDALARYLVAHPDAERAPLGAHVDGG